MSESRPSLVKSLIKVFMVLPLLLLPTLTKTLVTCVETAQSLLTVDLEPRLVARTEIEDNNSAYVEGHGRKAPG